MHPNPRRILPFVLLLVALAVAYWYYNNRNQSADMFAQSASGQIEATKYSAAPEIAGRVVEVLVQEGQTVQAGDVLVRLDDALLQAQRLQAEAAAQAAQESANAAAANYQQLLAGASPEQLAVLQTLIDKAQLAADALQEQVDDLPEAALDTTAGKQLQAQLDQAKAGLANAHAQYNLAKAGASSHQLDAAKAQSAAAESQARAAQANLDVLDVQLKKIVITAPVSGTVLSSIAKVGMVLQPGVALITIADLQNLELTVYVAEDRYGQLQLGQSALVSADSFPGEQFQAQIAHIADQAEFTPRNVQTAEGRKSTVFAIKLTISNSDGKLKAGMPVDVEFVP